VHACICVCVCVCVFVCASERVYVSVFECKWPPPTQRVSRQRRVLRESLRACMHLCVCVCVCVCVFVCASERVYVSVFECKWPPPTQRVSRQRRVLRESLRACMHLGVCVCVCVCLCVQASVYMSVCLSANGLHQHRG